MWMTLVPEVREDLFPLPHPGPGAVHSHAHDQHGNAEQPSSHLPAPCCLSKRRACPEWLSGIACWFLCAVISPLGERRVKRKKWCVAIRRHGRQLPWSIL